jgi:hypothetical protein
MTGSAREHPPTAADLAAEPPTPHRVASARPTLDVGAPSSIAVHAPATTPPHDRGAGQLGAWEFDDGLMSAMGLGQSVGDNAGSAARSWNDGSPPDGGGGPAGDDIASLHVPSSAIAPGKYTASDGPAYAGAEDTPATSLTGHTDSSVAAGRDDDDVADRVPLTEDPVPGSDTPGPAASDPRGDLDDASGLERGER